MGHTSEAAALTDEMKTAYKMWIENPQGEWLRERRRRVHGDNMEAGKQGKGASL